MKTYFINTGYEYMYVYIYMSVFVNFHLHAAVIKSFTVDNSLGHFCKELQFKVL